MLVSHSWDIKGLVANRERSTLRQVKNCVQKPNIWVIYGVGCYKLSYVFFLNFLNLKNLLPSAVWQIQYYRNCFTVICLLT